MGAGREVVLGTSVAAYGPHSRIGCSKHHQVSLVNPKLDSGLQGPEKEGDTVTLTQAVAGVSRGQCAPFCESCRRWMWRMKSTIGCTSGLTELEGICCSGPVGLVKVSATSSHEDNEDLQQQGVPLCCCRPARPGGDSRQRETQWVQCKWSACRRAEGDGNATCAAQRS